MVDDKSVIGDSVTGIENVVETPCVFCSSTFYVALIAYDDWDNAQPVCLDCYRRNQGAAYVPPQKTYEPSKVASSYDAIADVYDTFYSDPLSKSEDTQVFHELTPDFLTGRVLDLGCGTGWLLDHNRISTSQYLGLDISSGMLEKAKKKHPRHKFILGDMTSSVSGQWSDNIPQVFQTIVSVYGCLSYCGDPDEAVRNIARYLSPDGQFMVMAFGPEYYDVNRVFTVTKVEAPKARLYSIDALTELFQRCGLEVEKSFQIASWAVVKGRKGWQ